MGTYLSTPVTEKHTEENIDTSHPSTPTHWGVVDMQGWRKAMEDAHLARTNVPVNPDDPSDTQHPALVFGVFDGHGGPEVARFCALYFCSVLTQMPTWKEAHKDGPLETLEDGSMVVKEDESASDPTQPPSRASIGVALTSAFHALDRMIDDPNRREELVRLRAIKPEVGEVRVADDIPSVEHGPHIRAQQQLEAAAAVAATTQQAPPPEPSPLAPVETVPLEAAVDPKPAANEAQEEKTEAPAAAEQKEEEESSAPEAEKDSDEHDTKDDDSNEPTGKEEAAKLDQTLEDGEEEVVEEVSGSTAGKVSVMFQRLLNISGQGGQVPLATEEGQPAAPAAPATGPSAARPSTMQNGRMICNLPDHAVHAGATAIVGVIVDRILTVANAGDSRAVLCRDGTAVALSFDHKPMQERELSRIQKAGGFVNTFGRVNGNLNLSRSIGDLKYKQVPGIPPPEQMITAEPDIVQIRLEEKDEFIIFGCDGIWDCLSNEQAVEYVRKRIMTKTPVEIGKEMLDEIISEDPRVTQGIGGDNMTIMVVDLQPTSRQHEQRGEPQDEEEQGEDASPL